MHPNDPCAIFYNIYLPAFFSIFLVVMETTRHSLVIGQLSKRGLT